MIYVTGANGLVGSRLCACLGDYDVTKISYRDEVPDVFESHGKVFSDSSWLVIDKSKR